MGKVQQPFYGYRYMTPAELADDEAVTSLTIISTFQDDTEIHGVFHIGRAIGTRQRRLNHTSGLRLHDCTDSMAIRGISNVIIPPPTVVAGGIIFYC